MSDQELPQGFLPGTISLTFGHPDASTLPSNDLRIAADAVFRGSQARMALQYGPEQGSPALVDYLVDKFNREEKLNLTRENLMITAGSTGALDMIIRLYGRRNGVVLIEAPSYRDSIYAIGDHDIDLRQVPVDDNGLVVKALATRLQELGREGKSPCLLYTIPTFQNPSGVTLTQDRREAILALAREYDFLVVEDDVYRDLFFEGDVPPSFYELAHGRGVMRIGSFSKIMAAGLRLGWIIAEPDHIQRFVDCGAVQMGGGANPLVAHIVAEYCRAGHLEPHIAQLRQVYTRRRDVTLAALERYMPDGVTWTRPRGGFFIWLTVPEGIDVGLLRNTARQRGVDFSTGTGFFVQDGGEQNLRLAFSFVLPDEIRRGVAILSDVIREMIG